MHGEVLGGIPDEKDEASWRVNGHPHPLREKVSLVVSGKACLEVFLGLFECTGSLGQLLCCSA